MTVLGNSHRCVVCGIRSLVTAHMSDGVLGYCATDWLTVVLDDLPPGTTVTWTHDNTVQVPAGVSLPRSKAQHVYATRNNASPISHISAGPARTPRKGMSWLIH